MSDVKHPEESLNERSNTVRQLTNDNETFNSLIIVNNKLDIIFQYNKIKLVPFGEFLPFEAFLNKFGLKKITEFFQIANVDPFFDVARFLLREPRR